MTIGVVEVVRPGIASTFQDRGRAGLAHLGVGAAGAVDRELAALANRLVGNGPERVVIETCGNLELRAVTPVTIASTADLAPTTRAAGERVVVRPGGRGRLWHYVAIRGGFVVDAVLGSASTDTLAGLGPPPLVEEQRIEVGPMSGAFTVVDHAPVRELASVVRVLTGPRRDWFSERSWEQLLTEAWTVTTTSRVGVRLAGAEIERVVDSELPSEGLVPGAIQVPPGGAPVMMLVDHPTTGGYPVIAVVHPDDVAIVGQQPAGSHVRFRRYDSAALRTEGV